MGGPKFRKEARGPGPEHVTSVLVLRPSALAEGGIVSPRLVMLSTALDVWQLSGYN